MRITVLLFQLLKTFQMINKIIIFVFFLSNVVSQKLPNHSEKILIKRNTISIDFDWRSNESGFYYQHYDFAKGIKLDNDWSASFSYRIIGKVQDGGLSWLENRPHISIKKTIPSEKIKWILKSKQEFRFRKEKDLIMRNRFHLMLKSNKQIVKIKPYVGNEFFYDLEKNKYNKNWLVLGFDLTSSNQYAPTVYYKFISDLIDGKWISTYTLVFKITI